MMIDRKNKNFITDLSQTNKDVKDLKFTQYSGLDSIKIELKASLSVYDISITMTAGSRWYISAQSFVADAVLYTDANYDYGHFRLYVDTPPPSGNLYQGLKTTDLSSTPGIIIVKVNQIPYENGTWWQYQLRNIDSVSHTVYAKAFLRTTSFNPIFGYDWGSA